MNEHNWSFRVALSYSEFVGVVSTNKTNVKSAVEDIYVKTTAWHSCLEHQNMEKWWQWLTSYTWLAVVQCRWVNGLLSYLVKPFNAMQRWYWLKLSFFKAQTKEDFFSICHFHYSLSIDIGLDTSCVNFQLIQSISLSLRVQKVAILDVFLTIVLFQNNAV